MSEAGDSGLKFLNKINKLNSMSFPAAIQQIIDILPNAAYFSPVEQKCLQTCPGKRFFLS